LRPLPTKTRLHEVLDPGPFLDTAEMLMSPDVNPKAAVKKTVRKKATVKTRTKKKATSRNNKTASS
jgi:hypothetical protein